MLSLETPSSVSTTTPNNFRRRGRQRREQSPAQRLTFCGVRKKQEGNSPQQQQQESFVDKHVPNPPKPTHYTPYFEIADLIEQELRLKRQKLGRRLRNSESAYSMATKHPTNRKLCKETCCVETAAISLDQDDHRLINTEDGRDMSDLSIQQLHHRIHSWLPYLANNFNEDMIPCMIPGTIIQVDNHEESVQYFWNTVRPKLKVPFVLITSASDEDSPVMYHDYLSDPLLIKWYGTNPWLYNRGNWNNMDKFHPMHLGLSGRHPQSLFLTPF